VCSLVRFINEAAMLNVSYIVAYNDCSKDDEIQLGANEGRFISFTSAVLFSAANIISEMN
jgi:hypothetical protein